MFGLFGITFLTLTGVLVYATPELTLHPPGIVKAGDTLQLVCKVDLESVLDVVKITKVFNKQEFPIVTNKYIGNVELQGRYSAELTDDGTSTLTIEKVSGQDMGQYKCFKLGGNTEATEYPQIRVPVKRVALTYELNGEWLEPENDEEIVLKEGTADIPFKCLIEVDGSEKKPSYGITFNEEDYIGANKFSEKVDDTISVNETGLVNAVYKNTLTYDLKPSRDISGHRLECFAKMEEFPRMASAVTFRVDYAPEVVACEGKQTALVDTENAELICILKMAPKYDEYRWEFGTGDNMTEVLEGGDSTDIVAVAKKKKVPTATLR